MKLSLAEIIGAAIVIPIVSLVAVQLARRIGRWFVAALTVTFAETVRDVMAKDMARMGMRLGESIDELRKSITVDERRVQMMMAQVQNELSDRLTGVEQRLEVLERRIPLIDRRRYVKPPGEGE